MVIYRHSTVITKIMLLYNTEWQYDHGMAVNHQGKKFYNIGPWFQTFQWLVLLLCGFVRLVRFKSWAHPIEIFTHVTSSLSL